MHFRSYHDMVELVRRKAPDLPADIGLVVYVPRSGIIPATQIALQRNLPSCRSTRFSTAAATPRGSACARGPCPRARVC